MNLDLIIASIAFVVITVALYIWNIRKLSGKKSKKRKKREAREIIEINYLVITHNIKKERLLNSKFILLISLIDAFIICLVFLVVMLIPYALVWQLLTGFVLLLGLIYSIYTILGRILVKKGYDK
ncbi:MAG: hypothetical protein IJO63_01200 [Bacilli bacterium]|nr:hypothetical protein [Bacilli bacterium]